MRKILIGLIAAGVVVLTAAPAVAHVTVQPNEAPTGAFFAFVVRVPTEREDASTTKVEVQLPETLTNVSFQPKPGWNREIEMKKLDEPIEVFGEEVTEYVASVTWSAGEIAPGEFDEFGFSARTPEEETALEFPALQTYDSGEVVRWIGPADSDEPAALVQTIDLGLGEGEGPLSALAVERAGGSDDAGGDAVDDAEDSGESSTDAISWIALVLGAAGLAFGLVALSRSGSKT